jgi:dTDP-4-dehydrorhamnose reductase
MTPTPTRKSRIELWGGVEPTHNRVADRYYSQLERTGHDARLDDLERCAALGIRTLRYPVLWERTMPEADGEPDWRWADERLAKLRDLGITPIIGLLHHGSGPRHTSLLDPQFPAKLASYAGRVAARYPWVRRYTPVNEPLTTALFSALYGAWYPHARSDRAFTTALLTQVRATALAMRAIRDVNPHAELVQTDDLGKTHSTPMLAYQARFNNHRRWLAWDLLCGRVDQQHPLWNWLVKSGGARESELLALVEAPCPPDIIGVNHYVTSERYLTEDTDAYAARYHGGNGRHRYADVEAARCLTATTGIQALLHEAWERYRLPLAVTEAHIDSTREDQLRWVVEIWRAAERLADSGVDVRGVTLWALFGVFDWNCLVTECRGYYEPGAFDVRADPPRPTALASLAKSLATGIVPKHPLLAVPGWWKRPDRFLTTPVEVSPTMTSSDRNEQSVEAAPILITGATGTLGRAFARICEQRGIDYRLLSRADLDIADLAAVDATVAEHRPWAIVNAAGYVRVDDAERDSERCFRENTLGAQNLATICARDRVALVTFSSDLVFDGARDQPYVESDAPAPLNVYGRTKAEAEARVLAACPEALVVRTSAFFGPWDEYNYVTLALRAMRSGQPFRAATDMVVSPTYVPDLVKVSLDLLVDRAMGIYHVSHSEPVTWAEFALRAADIAGLSTRSLIKCTTAELGFAARRPRYSALATDRGISMPPLEEALRHYVDVYPRKSSRAGDPRKVSRADHRRCA